MLELGTLSEVGFSEPRIVNVLELPRFTITRDSLHDYYDYYD